MWANGMTPRSDGLTWVPGDFASDGTHPSTQGRRKVAEHLMRYFINSPHTQDWFLAYDQGDADTNGVINFDDYARIDGGFNNHRTGWTNGDFNYDGVINFDDYALIDANFNQQLAGQPRAVPEPGMAFTLAAIVFTARGLRGRTRRQVRPGIATTAAVASAGA
jgi:hypothetical protein